MLLKQLSETCGGPGKEHAVRSLIRTHLDSQVDELYTDALGNLFARKQAAGPRLMICAHMDEVALMVMGIEKNGMLKFSAVGGVDPRVLVAKTVVVGEKQTHGIIGAKPIHLQKPDERTRALAIDDLLIDIGARKQEEAEALVSIGDYAYFTTKFEEFGAERFKGKAFDDRVGCSLLVDLLSEPLPVDLFAVFTVQEEVGLRGAGPAAYAVEPELALTLEGTTASDVAGIDQHQHCTTVGAGPCLTFMDSSVIPDPKLVRRLLETADSQGIPVQMRRFTSGGTDSGAVQAVKTGVSTATISIPCRYIHSPSAVMSRHDYDAALRLIKAFVTSLKGRETI